MHLHVQMYISSWSEEVDPVLCFQYTFAISPYICTRRCDFSHSIEIKALVNVALHNDNAGGWCGAGWDRVDQTGAVQGVAGGRSRDNAWIPYRGCLRRFELLSLARMCLSALWSRSKPTVPLAVCTETTELSTTKSSAWRWFMWLQNPTDEITEENAIKWAAEHKD